VMEAFGAMTNRDGLIECAEGWNFIDWVPQWRDGEHSGLDYGPSGIINLKYVYTLTLAAAMEEWLGESEMAQRWRRIALDLLNHVRRTFWNESCSAFADDVRMKHFSEHAQCFAVLSGLLKPHEVRRIREALACGEGMVKTTISFTHYLFETYRQLDLIDQFYDRLSGWFDLARNGFKATPEQPEPSRSDCHGWAAHPIYHFYATVLGIRPAVFGFESVAIAPELGTLKHAAGRLVHPRGWIDIELHRDGEHLTGHVALPEGVSGVFKYAALTRQLIGGTREEISISRTSSRLPEGLTIKPARFVDTQTAGRP